MYHPNSTRTDNSISVDFGAATVASIGDMAQQCECGNEFLPDSVFCRRCGTRRPGAPVSTS